MGVFDLQCLFNTTNGSTVLARQASNLGRVLSLTGSSSAVVEQEVQPTDVKHQTMFPKASVDSQYFFGMPKLEWRFWKTMQVSAAMMKTAGQMEPHEIVLRDARKCNVCYEQTGFTLCPLKSKVVDWNAVATYGSEQSQVYQAELEAIIRELHPTVKKVVNVGFLLRGGPGENPPAKGGIHLDYHIDNELRQSYMKAQNGSGDPSFVDDPELELGLILGLWKPRNESNPVHDYPLFVGDASTFESGDYVPMYQKFQHILSGEVSSVVNVGSSVKFAEGQRWYYYHQ